VAVEVLDVETEGFRALDLGAEFSFNFIWIGQVSRA